MTDSIDVTWFWPDEATSQGHRLTNLHSWSYPEVPILKVKLSPNARFAAVQKILPQERATNSSVGFFDTQTWELRWRCKVRMPPGGNVIHPVGILFVSEERCILTDVDITMYERDRVIWEADVSLPAWPAEWPHEPHRGEYEAWRIVGSGTPLSDKGSLFLHVHWARILEPARWEPATWQDRYAVEVISITDGAWIRRFEEEEQAITPVSPRIVIDDARAVYKDGERILGTLEPPKGRRITAADISLESQRALVVLDARELLHLALPSN